MVNFFKRLFSKQKSSSLNITKDGEPAGRDLQMAVAMALLELSGRDDDYAPEEVGTILRAVASEFLIDKDTAINILEVADKERKDKPTLQKSMRILKESYNDSQRIAVISLLWAVLIADGKVEKTETRYLEQMRNRLELTEAQIEQGKLLATRHQEAEEETEDETETEA